MEDEDGVKAPVTRLRRRLSVEQSDDARSSSAPNTPTKKRGGRRAVKPELDLIDENAPENDTSKKITKKPNMKELDVDEKPVTPSRRSARIKSNTSIVLETTQTIESPRAKRATRRNSQVGSDNEAPLTPARLTRRTRRDSANADKAETQAGNKPIVSVTEVIVEEPETTSQKSNSEKSIEQTQSPSGLRKSPRLSLKKNRSGSIDLSEKEMNKSEKQKNNKIRDSTEFNEKEINKSDEHINSNKEIASTDPNEKEINKSDEHNNSNKENEDSQDNPPGNNYPVIKLFDISDKVSNDIEISRLSISNLELLNKLSNEPNKKNKNVNKSSSALTDSHTESLKYKRHRTKSWAGLSDPIQNDNKSYSDNETKKMSKVSLNTSSNDDAQNVSKIIKDNLNSSSNEKTKVVHNMSVLSVQKDEKTLSNSSNNKEKILSPLMHNSISSTNLFEKEPTYDMQTLVYIEESDSNSEKINTNQGVKEQDQEKEKPSTIFNFNKGNEANITLNKNDSCEPMDVDETLPDNIISNTSLLKTINMSGNTVSPKVNVELNSSVNEKSKSNRSSAILSQTLDKTTNENKSTLVLSQLKDITNENNVLQSPQIATDPKSKSDHALNITQDNGVNKKSISSNYSTSTPLQQKGLLKHTLHVNTSGINSNNTSKIDQSYSKANGSNTNKSNDTSEESGSDESSQEERNFVEDEAEDAGDDYESGDSRDEEDKQYERDHEIVQKGETLTSEDELSNDSDYEKDSFVVSSDQEDDDLLDGSADDLSMSDNELKMTAKSKKKYDEREIKEQKKASREMFESRHKLNVSNKSNKSDSTKIKKNRAVLDSTDSEDENIQVKKKKNKRMRLDSSHETSINKSLDNTSKIKHNNSLLKPVNNENDTNETEMTMIEHDVYEEIDPLSVDVKKEPKTPQKELENTSIQFIDPEQSDKTNKSHLHMTLAGDPLQDGDTSDSSDSSSNNEHIQNYDSVLNELNKSMTTKKNKEGDVSLNIDKKLKQKSVPIVDQLNLTQSKLKKEKQSDVTSENGRKSLNDKSKKESNDSKNKSLVEKNGNKKKSVSKTTEDSDNESSASIDLHLLFSEDSNNSEDFKIKHKVGEQNDEDESFIPLRKSQGKTDIFETSVLSNKSHTDANSHSAKKMKKKNKTLDKSSIEDEDCVDGTEVQFFLDTTGTHNSKALDVSLNASSAKKKKEQHTAIELEESDSDAPMEVSNKSVMKTQGQQVNIVEVMNTSLAALNKSKIKTPKSDKKKQRTESLTKEQTDNTEDKPIIDDNIETKINHSGMADTSLNKSMAKTPKSEKKKAKKISESQTAEEDSDATTRVANKSRTKGQEQFDIEEVINSSLALQNKSITKTPKSDKKKKRTSESQTIENTDATENEPDMEDDSATKGLANKSMDKSVSKTPKSEKKKTKRMFETQMAEQTGEEIYKAESTSAKNKSTIENDTQDETEKEENKTGVAETSINKSLTKTPKSGKKKKKLSESQAEIQISPDIKETTSKTFSSEKKKAKKMLESNDANNMGNVTESKEVVDSKKRKRKSSLNDFEMESKSEEEVPSLAPNINNSAAIVSKTKKRKISHNVEDSENLDQAPMTKTKITPIEKQRNQDIVKQKLPLQSQPNNIKDTTDINLSNKKGTKKRKEREDDEGCKISKVLKVNTADKVQVPRLPATILNQLEDRSAKKSHQDTKPKAISTTNFFVEETKVKKTKPSSYLEESVYLNEDEEGESKKQKNIKNPKVLPFLPTVSTSNSGYTTDFKVNVLPKQIQFVAKPTTTSNYKNDYLQSKKIKRLGTYELYKRNRTVKMSKF